MLGTDQLTSSSPVFVPSNEGEFQACLYQNPDLDKEQTQGGVPATETHPAFW